jgi:hypothetical protein
VLDPAAFWPVIDDGRATVKYLLTHRPGILVGGDALHPVRETTTLRVRGGEVMISDGPFAETKEQIAGYSVLECTDRDEAIGVSARHPTARFGTFERRPIEE